MIAIILSFIFISFIFLIIGKSAILYIDKINILNYNLIDSYFIGLCFSGTILNIWSLFLPTNISSFVFLLVLCSFFLIKDFIFFKSQIKDLIINTKINSLFLLSIIWISLIIIVFTLITPKLYDSYLYHINATQWNQYYKIVPGLANLHDRFGFNSSIFVMSAAFSFASVFNQFIFALSSLSTLFLLFWLIKQSFQKKGVIGLFSLIFLYYFIEQYCLDISSPGSDLLPNILIGFTILNLLFDDQSLKNKNLIFTIIPLFCVTLKLSTFPLALLSLIAIYSFSKTLFSAIKKVFALGSILIIPWMIRNVILSGYILYPMEALDFFNFEWEVPKERVIETKKWVYSWARIPFEDYHKVLDMPFKEWFAVWWGVLLSKNKFFFISASLAPVLGGLYALINRRKNNSNFFIALFIAYLGFILWLFTAPDFRFSFSFILILALMPLLLLKGIIARIAKIFNPLLLIPCFYIFFLLGEKSLKLFKDDYYSLKKVSSYAYKPIDVALVKEKRNINYLIKEYTSTLGEKITLYGPTEINTQCFDQFPCAPLLDQRFRLRGENLQDGFVKN